MMKEEKCFEMATVEMRGQCLDHVRFDGIFSFMGVLMFFWSIGYGINLLGKSL